MNDLEKSYVAGFTDGEGSILMQKAKRNCSRGWVLVPIFSITNTNKDVLKYINELLGCGSVTISKRNYPNKILYHLQVMRKKDMLRVLKEIEPFMRVKKRQAQLTIRFIESRSEKIPLDNPMKRIPIEHKGTNISKGTKSIPYTEEEIKIHEEIRKLNWRGLPLEERVKST